MSPRLLGALSLSALLAGTAAHAQDPEACLAPRLSDVGWTDITATTAIADRILSEIGYDPDILVLSVPVTFDSLTSGDIDVFLGNWMPLQDPIQTPLVEAGRIDVVQTNLEGAVIGLATNASGAELGIRTYADIARFQEDLGGQIYGIEPGASANATILQMIDDDRFGLGSFELVESSEQGMLAQVQRAVQSGEPIVFFGWRPHPMNVTLDMTYLTGSEDVFGPNEGGAEVLTVTRPGLADECPNMGRFLGNLVFDVEAEDVMMKMILDDGLSPEETAETWLKENPEAIDRWLEGVSTTGGEPAAPVVKAALGL
ncbi:choline ABC transporter substrate-binding protein [Rubellimicrobium arenae]|uniref:choline ABC transporter substrate-binding protein n=1 Tax=Rubellimicrobium arenae TaxID=2817372 RepID=UPI001B311738|nr:choline ABC transporter substrate-binding protein [Rubellimicrobium arenae]